MFFFYIQITHILHTFKKTNQNINNNISSNNKQNFNKFKEDFVPEDPLSECDIYEFECDYSRCIPIEKKCDGYPDCDDETDEIDCPPFTGKTKREPEKLFFGTLKSPLVKVTPFTNNPFFGQLLIF